MVRAALEEAREQVAALLQVRPRQVVFTSGGTEAVNAAVWGATRTDPGPVACSAVEHSAVRDASARVGTGGPHRGRPCRSHRARPPSRKRWSRCRRLHGRLPALVHCQWANHEVGTVQPVAEVVEHCHRLGRAGPMWTRRPRPGTSPWTWHGVGADLVSVSSHKLGRAGRHREP